MLVNIVLPGTTFNSALSVWGSVCLIDLVEKAERQLLILN